MEPPIGQASGQGGGEQGVPPISTGPPEPNRPPQPPPRSTRLGPIGVNVNQRGNPLLRAIRNVPWEYAEQTAESDYTLGATTGALYLSLKYHRLHPEYITRRFDKWRGKSVCRILLVLVDLDDHRSTIREISQLCILEECTLVLAWSVSEAGRYLETFKSYERRPPDLIQERLETTHIGRITNALTQVRGVNRTDVLTLTANFGSLYNIANAEQEALASCPGLGPTKVEQLAHAFRQPFFGASEE